MSLPTPELARAASSTSWLRRWSGTNMVHGTLAGTPRGDAGRRRPGSVDRTIQGSEDEPEGRAGLSPKRKPEDVELDVPSPVPPTALPTPSQDKVKRNPEIQIQRDPRGRVEPSIMCYTLRPGPP